MATTKWLGTQWPLINLNCLVSNGTTNACLWISGNTSGSFSIYWSTEYYCENTDKVFVSVVVVIVRLMSSVSTIPAALVTSSSCHGCELSTIDKVEEESVIPPPPVLVTLSPFQVFTSPPKRSIATTSVTVWVALTVWVIEPDVKLGVTDCADTGPAISNNGSRYFMAVKLCPDITIVSIVLSKHSDNDYYTRREKARVLKES